MIEPSDGKSKKLTIDTGFEWDSLGEGAPHFHMSDAKGRELVLKETFSDVHVWGTNVADESNPMMHCTSKSAARLEWLDYIWYSGLQPQKFSQTIAPSGKMPSVEEPSDHILLAAQYIFDSPKGQEAPGRALARPGIQRRRLPTGSA